MIRQLFYFISNFKIRVNFLFLGLLLDLRIYHTNIVIINIVLKFDITVTNNRNIYVRYQSTHLFFIFYDQGLKLVLGRCTDYIFSEQYYYCTWSGR